MYSIDWGNEDVLLQLTLLPYDVAMGLTDVLIAVCLDPWGYERRADEPLDGAARWVTFGNGFGRVKFLILPHAGQVLVAEIEWNG